MADNNLIGAFKTEPQSFLITHVKEEKLFYGLASYYNKLNYFLVEKEHVHEISDNSEIKLDNRQWLVISGRLKVLVIKQENMDIIVKNKILKIKNPSILSKESSFFKIIPKSQIITIAPELDQIRYYHLWKPLSWLSRQVEYLLEFIHQYFPVSWGITVVFFSVLLKILLLPISVMTVRLQKSVSLIQTELAPKQAIIKQNFDGEEAHNKLMETYKESGVSPFYTLKPMLGSLIQVPILIAVFNALGEMSQFSGQSFLWINDLSYPDSVITFDLTVPLLGNSINLLPFFMTVVTIYSTIIYQNKHAPESEVNKQKRNLYLMAFLFFILFYPFPSVMVLYWTLANILQYIQQKYLVC